MLYGRVRKAYVVRQQVLVGGSEHSLANKVANMAQDNEDEVANVGGQEDIVWGVNLNSVQRRSRNVLAGVSVLFICAMTKFRVKSGENLLRRGRSRWENETVDVV